MKHHTYKLRTEWIGNRGTGTSGYRDYARDHVVTALGKMTAIQGSSDRAFRGDAARYNPEELLVSALSACHMLAFLHLCADAGVVVIEYDDEAEGTMRENPEGSGEFTEVLLSPQVTVHGGERVADLDALHHKAHELCFIARSVNFPVEVRPRRTIVKTL